LGTHDDLKHIKNYIQSLFEQRVINENIIGTHASVIDSEKLVKKIMTYTPKTDNPKTDTHFVI